MISKGFVGIFSGPLDKMLVSECVASWLARFERVEQVTPDPGSIATVILKEVEDLMWEPNMQFRVVNGEDFAWVYMTMDKRCMETSGLPSNSAEEISLSLEVLLELPQITNVVDQRNEKKLDELEAEGLL
ncbi:MAG: hypothetical protein ACAI35_00975 [Candidatus Methylacidiphilales bacterium]|nr:hypothetical protein [Candidatus Methylacidiphilales bacterium]